MFSIIYTPTEGDAIQNYSRIFRRPEGCFLNINDLERVHHDLAQWGKPEDIDYIVVTGTRSTHFFFLPTCHSSCPSLADVFGNAKMERKSWVSGIKGWAVF